MSHHNVKLTIADFYFGIYSTNHFPNGYKDSEGKEIRTYGGGNKMTFTFQLSTLTLFANGGTYIINPSKVGAKIMEKEKSCFLYFGVLGKGMGFKFTGFQK